MNYFDEFWFYTQKMRYCLGQWHPEEELEKKYRHKIMLEMTPVMLHIKELKELKDMPNEDDTVPSKSIAISADKL